MNRLPITTVATRLLTCVACALLAAPAGRAIDPPANPDASPEAHSLLSYLESIHGSHILSGQQEFPSWPWNEAAEDDIEYVQRVTGRWPAVRGFDFMFYTHSAGGRGAMQVTERAIEWARQGGIVTFCVHWFMDVGSPNGPAFYTPSASTQYTNYDIRQAILPGTPENAELMAEMDMLAAELAKLRDAGVPVIWRPFHEVGGNWFWWSRHGAAPLIAAWRLMFDRFTGVHGLDNLVWEFNPTSLAILTNWYPGDAYVDLVSLDIYPGSGHPVFATEYNQFLNFTGGRKLVALSENGRIPDPDQLAAQGAHWLYFCTWNGEFITTDTYNTLAFKQTVFNHARVLTRDELPGRPAFTEHPLSRVVDIGTPVTLSTDGTPGAGLAYQWYRNGVAIAGATSPDYEIASAQAAHSATYTVVKSNFSGSTTSHAAVVVVGPQTGQLANLSTRGHVLTGDEVLIAGFVIAGAQPRTILMRGVGPSLVPFGVDPAAVLADPRITLFAEQTAILANDEWSLQDDASDLAPVAAAVGAFPLPAGSPDAALVATLQPHVRYSVHVTGHAGATGIALAELYDVDIGTDGSRLANISTRGRVGTGNSIMIPGLVVGQAGRRLLVRGVGPGLSGWNLAPLLPNPVVHVVDRDGHEIAVNDNWGDAASAPEVAAAAATVGAFALADGSNDAALLVTLPPGIFAALVSDAGGETGIALVEVYDVP